MYSRSNRARWTLAAKFRSEALATVSGVYLNSFAMVDVKRLCMSLDCQKAKHFLPLIWER